MSLLPVELTRLRVRRTTWLLALVAVVISIGFAIKTAHDTRPISRTERATAAAQADREARSDAVRRVLRVCAADPAGFVGPGATQADCERTITPTAADFLDRRPLRLGSVMGHNGMSVVLLTLVVVALIGAAFAGADWASGSMVSQLLAEPRRGRVWAAKAGAVAIGGLVVGVLTSAVFWVPLRLLAAERGLQVTVGTELVWYVVRAVVLSAVVALVAYALSMLFRQTVITIGLLLGLSLLAELLLGLVPVPENGWLSPSHNVYAWVVGRTRYLDPSITCPVADCDRLRTLEMWPAAALLGGGALVVCAVSAVVFGRRDVA